MFQGDFRRGFLKNCGFVSRIFDDFQGLGCKKFLRHPAAQLEEVPTWGVCRWFSVASQKVFGCLGVIYMICCDFKICFILKKALRLMIKPFLGIVLVFVSLSTSRMMVLPKWQWIKTYRTWYHFG